MIRQEMVDSNDETGCAKTALNAAGVDEGLLNIAQCLIGTQTFDGGDLGIDC